MFLGCSWDVPGTFLGCSWDVPGTFLGCSWDVPELFHGCSWDASGTPLEHSWKVMNHESKGPAPYEGGRGKVDV